KARHQHDRQQEKKLVPLSLDTPNANAHHRLQNRRMPHENQTATENPSCGKTGVNQDGIGDFCGDVFRQRKHNVSAQPLQN
ncbi:MAG: hypothetical protein IK089_07790, partial [Oxalobacter sp.]|nr:hypothetical protein [Oxalobacter sp.]